MSLINEALKRAEAESRQDEGGDAPTGRRTRPRAVAALAVVVIAAVCAFTYLSVPPQVKPEASGRPQLARAAAARRTVASGVPAITVEKLPRARLAAAGPASEPSPPAATMPTSRPTSRPAEEIAATSRPAFDASQFRLGAILKSGDGAHAVINGHMVTVGDDVSGARVVVIGPYHVVLEKDGKQLSLRM
jgi:hypothetical protein